MRRAALLLFVAWPALAQRQPAHLWSGEMHVTLKLTHAHGSSEAKSDIEARMREYPSPLIRPDTGKRYGTHIDLEPEGSVLHSSFHSEVTTPAGGTTCRGNADLTLTIQPQQQGYGHASGIWITSIDADTTPWLGFSIKRGTPRYVISIHGTSSDKFVANCNSWLDTPKGRRESQSTTNEAFAFAVAGRPPLVRCDGPLEHECDPEARTIAGENGRMAGSFHRSWSDDMGFHHDLEVRWSLCRDDVPCAAAPPSAESNPCGGTAQQDGLLEVCQNQERELTHAMNARWTRYQNALNDAAPNRAAFEQAIVGCTAWDATQLALEVVMATDLPSAGAPEEIVHEAEEVKEALETINGLVKTVTTGDSSDLWTPDEIDHLQTATETIQQFIDAYQLRNSGNADAFLQKLDDCDAPLSHDMRVRAQQYLLTMQRAFDELHEFHKLANDVRSKENECLQKQWDAYAACVQNARCNHAEEPACDMKRPPGNWPAVP